MNSTHKMRLVALAVGLAAGLASTLALAGCGTPGAPLPPSLNLPEPVTDLAANRAGNQVTLTWTMPKKNTDKLLLKGEIAVRACRKEAPETCDPAGAELSLAPGAGGTLTETVPAALVSGAPRPLSYFVELRNRNGRSAGLSNAAVVLAGEAPAPVTGLAAAVHRNGIVLRWTTLGALTPQPSPAAIRLQRKLLTPPQPKPPEGLLASQPEPAEENLLVDSCAEAGHRGICRALDRNIRFGQTYEYRAQRVARVTMDGKTFELVGELSGPVRVEAQDIFPPEPPAGLAAVATTGETGAQTAIDLSWQPVADPDLAGYIVYRREGEAPWQRISPAAPLVPPAFRDTEVQPGRTYRYAVSSIGQNGHESARSAETEESVPSP